MKKTRILIGFAIVTLVITGGFGIAMAHMGGGYGYGSAGSYDHMGGYGSMMDNDRSNDEQPCWSGEESTSKVQINKEEAKGIISFQLRRSNPNLKVGKVTEKEEGFEITIVTKDNSLVDRLVVEKNTGRIYRASQ